MPGIVSGLFGTESKKLRYSPINQQEATKKRQTQWEGDKNHGRDHQAISKSRLLIVTGIFIVLICCMTNVSRRTEKKDVNAHDGKGEKTQELRNSVTTSLGHLLLAEPEAPIPPRIEAQVNLEPQERETNEPPARIDTTSKVTFLQPPASELVDSSSRTPSNLSSRPKSLSASQLQKRLETMIGSQDPTARPTARTAVGPPPPPPLRSTPASTVPSVKLVGDKPALVNPVVTSDTPKPTAAAPPTTPNSPPLASPLTADPPPMSTYAHLMEPNPKQLLKVEWELPFFPADTPLPIIHPSEAQLKTISPQFSQVYCIGDRGRAGTADDTSCRFKNLCYDLEKSDWLFYRNPAEADYPLLTMDFSTIQTDFPDKLLNLRSMGIEKDAQYWTPTKIIGTIPNEEGTYWPNRNKNNPALAGEELFILFHSHYPSNIGHILGDDLFPIYNLMQSFHLLSNRAQLIMSRGCEIIFPQGEGKKVKLCEKFMSKMLPGGITTRGVLSMTNIENLKQALNVPPNTKRVCFSHLLAGLSPFGFQQSLGKADAWRGFQEFYLRNMGISPSYTPRKQRIVVSVKDGKRGFYNWKEVIEHLKAEFGHHYEVHTLELRSLDGWKNELSYLLDTSILITPCGGVSMSAMFLPKGSAMIIVDYWSTRVQSSVGMEDKLWSNVGYIRSFHYPFVESEVILPEKGEWGQTFSRSNFGDMRGYGMVKVDLPRLTEIVKAAVDHVDNFMVLGQN